MIGSGGSFLAALASVWTGLVWATVQEVSRRQKARVNRPDPRVVGPSPWPHLTCAVPLGGGDVVDGFAAGGAVPFAYPGPLSWVFLACEDDPPAQVRALHHAETLSRQGHRARALVTRVYGRNRKVAQLAQLPAPDLMGGYVLCLDSDVAPSSVRAASLVALLVGDPNLGVAWQPTAPNEQADTWGDKLSSAILGAGPHAMPLLAALDGDSPVGKVLAYAPQALARAGGWGVAIDALGDDVAIGRSLRGQGSRVVALGGAPAQTLRRGQSVAEVWRRFARWLDVVRAQRRWLLLSYPLYLAYLPPLLLLWTVSRTWGAPLGWVVAGSCVAIGSRLQLAFLARRSCLHAVRWSEQLRDVFLSDLILLSLFCLTPLRRTVWWNGRVVSPKGRTG